MLPIQKKISSYNYSSRQGNAILYIVLHYTGNKGDTAKNNVDYFYNGNRGASAHYFVDDNEIWQSVEDSNSAWSVGGGTSYGITNRNSISVEMCCQLTGIVSIKTEDNALELVKYLMNKYNVPMSRVVRHYDCNSIRKICPNWSNNNWERWYNFKAKLEGKKVNNVVVATPPPISTEANKIQKAKEYVGDRCKELQEKLIKLGYDCGGYGADGDFGKGTYESVIKFQRDNGLVADGLVGTQTWAKINEKINALNKTNSFSNWVARLQAECNRQGFSNQVVDGVPGTNTLKGCPQLKTGSNGNITKLLQERLTALGYNTNGIDGIFGSGTYKAVKAYQGAKGLQSDGVVGQNTWKKLLGL